MTPLERAARAVREQIAFEQDEDDGDRFMVEGGLRGHEFFNEIARALIEAIREPSEAMIKAAWSEASEGGDPPEIYAAMIDALLKEGR